MATEKNKKIKTETFLVIVLVIIFSEFLLARLTGSLGIAKYVSISLIRIIDIVSVIVILIAMDNKLSTIGIERTTILHGIKKGAFWSLSFGVVAAIGFGIIYLTGNNPLLFVKTRLPHAKNDIVLFFIAGGLLAPIAEEIFFRGIIYGFFRQSGVFFAIVITTVFFVSVHSLSGNIPVPQIVGGIVFALSYEIEKSLLVPVIIHATGNIAIFTISLL